jgi:hypothetical protein
MHYSLAGQKNVHMAFLIPNLVRLWRCFPLECPSLVTRNAPLHGANKYVARFVYREGCQKLCEYKCIYISSVCSFISYIILLNI